MDKSKIRLSIVKDQTLHNCDDQLPNSSPYRTSPRPCGKPNIDTLPGDSSLNPASPVGPPALLLGREAGESVSELVRWTWYVLRRGAPGTAWSDLQALGLADRRGLLCRVREELQTTPYAGTLRSLDLEVAIDQALQLGPEWSG